MGTGHVDVSSDSLAFVPPSLQMEDSNSNKENMATLFTICECASLFSSRNTGFCFLKLHMFEGFACMHVHVPPACLGPAETRTVLGSLELELKCEPSCGFKSDNIYAVYWFLH